MKLRRLLVLLGVLSSYTVHAQAYNNTVNNVYIAGQDVGSFNITLPIEIVNALEQIQNLTADQALSGVVQDLLNTVAAQQPVSKTLILTTLPELLDVLTTLKKRNLSSELEYLYQQLSTYLDSIENPVVIQKQEYRIEHTQDQLVLRDLQLQNGLRTTDIVIEDKTLICGNLQLGSNAHIGNLILTSNMNNVSSCATGIAAPAGATGVTGSTGATGATGAHGLVGPVGKTGATGAAGMQGPIGPIGAMGNTGPAGIAGAVGSQGLMGNTGAMGLMGAQGQDGLAGNTGATGVTGDAGVDGVVGATGNTGATGPAGLMGPIGAMGNTGATGLIGAQGQDGIAGNTGATGATGDAGVDGAVGATGNTGATGHAGLMGPIGAMGNTGATGLIGAQGQDGIAGNTGATGAAGDTGVDGAVGPMGNTGATGLMGATGPLGAQGEMGPVGATGAMGIPGPIELGNTLRVDKIYGSDANGQREGAPFLTINAALAQAHPGDTVWIFPGIYEESIVIPDGVAIRGFNAGGVIIRRNSIVIDTDLVVMGESTRLEDVSLQMISQNHVRLRCIVFPGTSMTTSRVRTVQLLVDNSGASPFGDSDVIGVHSIGTGFPPEAVSTMRAVTIIVHSTGAGNKRGILIDTMPHQFNVRDVNVMVSRVGSENSGSYIGVEVNQAGATFVGRSMSIGGTNADISQSAGTLILGMTDLLNANANELGFTDKFYPIQLIFSDPSELPGGAIRYMRPGTGTAAPYDIFLRAAQKCVIKAIHVRAAIGPGLGATDTWTLRKNGQDTPLSVSLSDMQTKAINERVSVTFMQGDDISVKVQTSPSSTTQDIIVNLDLN